MNRSNLPHLLVLCLFSAPPLFSAIALSGPPAPVHPLDAVTISGAPAGSTVEVLDGEGKRYFQTKGAPDITFLAGGTLGTQTVVLHTADGRPDEKSTFTVNAETSLSGAGAYSDLFEVAKKTMYGDGIGSIDWRGRTYRFFDPWILDHSNTTKGMQYFSPVAADMVDLFGASQKANGMIWSFAFPDQAPQHQYHYWAYKDQGYAWADSNVLFARQPVENHNEGNFVDALYLCWKASGDTRWMESHLDQAKRALDYSVTDDARWSREFQLLKRGYTIDSWDFQPDDKYLVHFPMGSEQQIDPKRTKFVIFFGDNTGYAHACDQLAEMLRSAGRDSEAEVYSRRAHDIRERLNKLAWNGKFYTHHVEIDPTVRRDLGVPEDQQFAMSNAYSLNRGTTQPQIEAIIGSYQDLRGHLPPGSPGEWYAVYPPYKRGFGAENQTWQYMNGGVQAHAAGELARGALEHGFEQYGADILTRLDKLGDANGGKLYFAYTGAFPPGPPPAQFTPVDLSAEANMSLHGEGHGAAALPWLGHTDGNDMHNLPVGDQTLAGIRFHIAGAQDRLVIGTSRTNHTFPASVDVPVGRQANAVYLLNAAEKTTSSGIGATVHFHYSDGSVRALYLRNGEDLSPLWFPHLDTAHSGLWWRGPNGICGDVGVAWTAIANPEPAKTIDHLSFEASADGSTYALLGVTLADRMPWHAAGPISYGGPDNWSAGLVMSALLEGLAGVESVAPAMTEVRFSPRWAATSITEASATVRFAASDGYVTYKWTADPASKTIHLEVTGNAERAHLRILLPAGSSGAKAVTIDGTESAFSNEQVEHSTYVAVEHSLRAPINVVVHYK